MSKLLRKYKMWILAVGGSLLMIAWLFPQAMQQFGGMNLSSTVARFEGGKFTGQDFQDAQQEIRALSEFPMMAAAIGLTEGNSLRPDAVEYWMLLTTEAKKGGFVGGAEDGRALLDDVAEQWFNRQQMFGQQADLASIRQRFEDSRRVAGAGRPEKWVDKVLAKAAGSMRMMSVGRSLGASISTKESQLFAWELYDAAVADLVLVPASAVSAELTAPDETRLTAHFDKYKNTRPGDTANDNPMGIGYKRAPAVRVEWVTVARQTIIDSMPADPVEVNKYWRQNRDKFGPDFAAAKAGVEAEFKRVQGEKRLEAVRNAMDRQKLKLLGALEPDGRYKKIPADWAKRAPSLDVLLEPARTALDLPTAAGLIFHTPADSIFRAQNDLRQLPGIGTSTGRMGDAPFVTFAQAASEVRELGGTPALHAAQVGMLYGPLTDAMQQNEFYFRVVEARPEGAPDAMAEVMDAMKADITALDGFALLKSQAEAYRERLAAKGAGDLLSISGVRSSLDAVVRREFISVDDPNQTFSLREADIPQVRGAIMDRVTNWDPKSDVAALPAADRAVVVAEPSVRGLVLALVKARRPLTSEKLDASMNEVSGYAFQKLTGPARGIDPYSYEALKARLKFRPIGGEEPPAPAPTPAPTPAPSAG